MPSTIRVWAVGEARLPIPGMPGRFVARGESLSSLSSPGVVLSRVSR